LVHRHSGRERYAISAFTIDARSTDPRACAAFVDFVCHLVSANGNLIEPCIRVLVARLLPSEGEHLHTGRYRSPLADRADVSQTLKYKYLTAWMNVSMMLWNNCFEFFQRVRRVW
jgi:hypothetical protein